MESSEHIPKISSKQEPGNSESNVGASVPVKPINIISTDNPNHNFSRNRLGPKHDIKGDISDSENNQAAQLPDHSQQKVPEKSEKATKEFIWDLDLSENAQKLYLLLLGEQGDIDVLPKLAKFEGFDLEAALEELREFDVLDESDPNTIFLNIFRKKY